MQMFGSLNAFLISYWNISVTADTVTLFIFSSYEHNLLNSKKDILSLDLKATTVLGEAAYFLLSFCCCLFYIVEM